MESGFFLPVWKAVSCVLIDPLHKFLFLLWKKAIKSDCHDNLNFCHTFYPLKKHETHAVSDGGSGMPNDRKLAWAHAIRYSISLTREPLSLKFTRFPSETSCDLCI